MSFDELADAADAARPPRLHWLMTGVPGDTRYVHMQSVGEKPYGTVPPQTDCGRDATVPSAIADSGMFPGNLPDDICPECITANVAAGHITRDPEWIDANG